MRIDTHDTGIWIQKFRQFSQQPQKRHVKQSFNKTQEIWKRYLPSLRPLC